MDIQKIKKFILRKIIYIVLILIVLIGSFLIILQTRAEKEPQVIIMSNHNVSEEIKKTDKLSLSFVGDILMHSAERKSGFNEIANTYNFDIFFSDIRKYIKNKDFVIGSFETPVIKEDSDKKYSGYPAFKNPPEILEAVKNAGINALVVSNNHILDQGGKGAIETMNWIEHYGIPYTGIYKSLKERDLKPVLFIEKNNIKTALLNYAQLSNMGMGGSNSCVINFIELEKIKKDIEYAKENKTDVIIVWLHFGDEYQRMPSQYQKDTVQSIAKMGADIIIGSHPHVLEPMTMMDIDGRKVFVAYSLGNFISNQYWRYSTDGMILNIDIEKENNKIQFKNITYIPTAVVREYKGQEIKNEKVVKTSDKDSDFITGAISRGILKGNEIKFRIVAVGEGIYDFENKLDQSLTQNDYIRLKTTWEDTTSLIGETDDFKIYRDSKTENLKLKYEKDIEAKAENKGESN